MKKRNNTERIYLDHASTTPIDESVLRAMKPFLTNQFHNPSALYREGVAAKEILETSRKEVALTMHALPDEIIFTGSGTESDNLAILGIVKESKKTISRPHVILSAIEHPAVLELVSEINRMGGEVSIVYPESNGIVSPEKVQELLKSSTVLVSIMYANNEIGTIQPIKDIAKVIRYFKKTHVKRKANNYPYFHTDASQAANYCSLNVLELSVDLMTLDGSKVYGPKGVGILFVKRGVPIEPIMFGGGQEKGLRSGTENLAYIVGFTKAILLSQALAKKESERLSKLRDKTIQSILAQFPHASLNGDGLQRLPNNINICFPGIDSEYAVIKADAAGILCSTASSCRTLSENVRSYVLDSLGKDDGCAESSLRFTMGRSTTAKEMNTLLKLLPHIISQT